MKFPEELAQTAPGDGGDEFVLGPAAERGMRRSRTCLFYSVLACVWTLGGWLLVSSAVAQEASAAPLAAESEQGERSGSVDESSAEDPGLGSGTVDGDVATAPDAEEVSAESAPSDDPSVDDSGVKAQAASAFSVGKDAFNDGDYMSAASHFLRADSLVPNPLVLDLAIGSYEEAGRSAEAATLISLGQQLYPGDARFEQHAAWLKHAKQDGGRLLLRCSSGCLVVLDDQPQHGPALRQRTFYVTPGSHQVRVSWVAEGVQQSDVRSFSVERGASETLQFGVSEGEARASEPARAGVHDGAVTSSSSPPIGDTAGRSSAREAKGLSPLWLYSGVGVSAALLGAATWSAIDTQNNPGKEAVLRDCVAGDVSCPTYQRGLKNQRRTNILWGVSAASVAVVVTLALFTDFAAAEAEDPGASGVAMHSWVGPGGASMMGARGAF